LQGADAAYQDFSIAPEFLSSLASIGQEGTLRRRLPRLPDQVMIRGKTGSLRDVVGFAGYVSGPATGVHAVGDFAQCSAATRSGEKIHRPPANTACRRSTCKGLEAW